MNVPACKLSLTISSFFVGSRGFVSSLDFESRAILLKVYGIFSRKESKNSASRNLHLPFCL
jgi:hypothetical protein